MPARFSALGLSLHIIIRKFQLQEFSMNSRSELCLNRILVKAHLLGALFGNCLVYIRRIFIQCLNDRQWFTSLQNNYIATPCLHSFPSISYFSWRYSFLFAVSQWILGLRSDQSHSTISHSKMYRNAFGLYHVYGNYGRADCILSQNGAYIRVIRMIMCRYSPWRW